jgi:F-box and WD-40 domain protein 1/11
MSGLRSDAGHQVELAPHRRRIVAASQDGRILIVDFGLRKDALERNDGMPIDNIDLLRAIPFEKTNAIMFRNP